MYSSNIGSARMALAAGAERQREFLAPARAADRCRSNSKRGRQAALPGEVARGQRDDDRLRPRHRGEPAADRVARGAAIVNGGILHPPTMLKLPAGRACRRRAGDLAETSEQMRKLMRLVVEYGTAKLAEAPGYVVGGKTGTAEKVTGRHYAEKQAAVVAFVGAFPMNDPQYVVLTMVDEPHGNKASHGYATAGWTVAPAVGRIIQRIAPLSGVQPVDEISPEIVERCMVESACRARSLKLTELIGGAAPRLGTATGQRRRSRDHRPHRRFAPGRAGLSVCRAARHAAPTGAASPARRWRRARWRS